MYKGGKMASNIMQRKEEALIQLNQIEIKYSDDMLSKAGRQRTIEVSNHHVLERRSDGPTC